MQRFAAPLVLVIMVGANPARADEAEPSLREREEAPHLRVSGTFGIATPLGIAGLELEAQLARWLSLSAGAGLGATGPQLAVMSRFAAPVSDVTKLYVGAGLSAGHYEWNELLVFDEPAKKTWERAFWLNGELGVERQLARAWSGRMFFGIGQVLNEEDAVCNDEHCLMEHQEDGVRQKYIGFSLARAFYAM